MKRRKLKDMEQLERCRLWLRQAHRLAERRLKERSLPPENRVRLKCVVMATAPEEIDRAVPEAALFLERYVAQLSDQMQRSVELADQDGGT
jgi:hypothetical protein